MRKTSFKANITKLGLAFLLIVPLFATNIPSAYALTEYPMFKQDANIIKFTHKLIYKSLYLQRRNSLNENEDSKKNKRTWMKFNDLAKATKK